MNEIDEQIKNFNESLDEVKKKANYKGYTLLFLVLLVGITIGFMLGSHQAVTQDSILGDYNIGDCENSLSCEDFCLSFYEDQPSSNIDNHSLECSYKCLTLKNCLVPK